MQYMMLRYQKITDNGSGHDISNAWTPGIFFGVLRGRNLAPSGAKIQPLSQWDSGDFFPNLKKKSQSKKKSSFAEIQEDYR